MSVDLPACGRIVDGCHRLAIRVYYEDTDAGGIVYHANYLRFFERARSEFLRCLEIDHAAAWRDAEGAATAMGFAVRSVTLDYVSPALLDDALVIDSRVTALGAAWVDVEQRALRGGDCLARACLKVALTDGLGRPRRLPKAWRAAFETVRQAAVALTHGTDTETGFGNG